MYTVRGRRRPTTEDLKQKDGSIRKPGRPMKPKSELSLPRKLRNHLIQQYAQRLRDADNTTRSLSVLERLPNEIIQQIFFDCFEINLLQTSSHLASILSTESTFRALILFAYFDDHEYGPVEVNQFLPARYRVLTVQEKIRLQTGILGCSWFTPERLTSCLTILSRLNMVQAWCKEAEQEAEIRADSRVEEESEAVNETNHVESLPDLHDQAQLRAHYQPHVHDHHGDLLNKRLSPDMCCPYIITWKIQVQASNGRVYKTRDKAVSTLPARVLADWLLLGEPWSTMKLGLLQSLRQGLRFIDTDRILCISADAVFEGMANAIRQKCLEALSTLLELHNSVFSREIVLGEDESASLTPRCKHRLPIELFHLATRQGAESSAIIWMLARGAVDTITDSDALLTAWAIHAQAAGCEVARWLLQHMSGSIDYGLRHNERLFVDGRLSPHLSTACRMPSACNTFAEEIGYWIGDSANRPVAIIDPWSKNGFSV